MDICQSGALIICQDSNKRERGGKNLDFKFAHTAVLCCHPAADSGTAAQSTEGTSFVTQLFSFIERLIQENM